MKKILFNVEFSTELGKQNFIDLKAHRQARASQSGKFATKKFNFLHGSGKWTCVLILNFCRKSEPIYSVGMHSGQTHECHILLRMLYTWELCVLLLHHLSLASLAQCIKCKIIPEEIQRIRKPTHANTNCFNHHVFVYIIMRYETDEPTHNDQSLPLPLPLSLSAS